MIDQADLIEAGEARWAGGRVVAVYDVTRQSILQADVAIGATTLGPLDTVDPFNSSGGNVAVTLPGAAGPLTFAYSSVDYVALTLTLVTGPAVVLTTGSVVRPDPILVDRMADVREGTQQDPIACRVPYAMRPWLPVGTRTEGQGEEVMYGPTTGAGYALFDVLGAVPLLPEGGSWVGDMPVGTIMAWPMLTLPTRWLRADGTLQLVANYPELAALLGATYGGDGISTFGVPNLSERVPRGALAAPAGTGGTVTHTHAGTGQNTDTATAHTHGSAVINVSNPGTHAHGAAPIAIGNAGGHAHASAGSHQHGAGSYGTGASNSNVTVQAGSGTTVPQTGHGHDVTGTDASAGSHTHASDGVHSHGTSGQTGDQGGHSHSLSGPTDTGGGHSHAVTGTGAAGSSLPPYLDLIYIIKATPGGDPLADGTYIEVRDEGIPDVPAATALDFRGAGVDVVQEGPVAVVTVGSQSGVTDHGALTGLTPDDDHPQYATNARGDVRWAGAAHAHAGVYEPAGTVATHAAAADPHPVYLTPTEGNAAYEPLGAVSTHAGLADPHSGYATDSELSTAIGAHVTSYPHDHPDTAAHDGMGLATDVELAAHAGGRNAHGTFLDDLTDVAAPSPTSGQLLGFTGSGWANVSPSAGSHPDLATHDALGLATDAELATHTANATAHQPRPFPVGYVYLSTVATNPATLLGYGTWAQIAQGRMLIGVDTADARWDVPKDTGGTLTHTHTSAGGHTHDDHSNAVNNHQSATNGTTGGSMFHATNLAHLGIHSNQGAHAHDAQDNLPPFLAVYMWERTA